MLLAHDRPQSSMSDFLMLGGCRRVVGLHAAVSSRFFVNRALACPGDARNSAGHA